MSAQQQYIEVGIAEERYAIPIQDVQEIIRMQPYLPIPNARRSILGVINLRGSIVPVVTPGSRFRAEESELSRMVIVQLDMDVVAFVVDRVHRVTTYNQMHHYEEAKRSERFITGIGLNEADQEWVNMLDVVTLLQEDANAAQ
ncbi:chemotaxis protein CheW [Paenibacillus sp. PR3]|uniref:Chemotaxis protein CheW n=1 Tax=Paenibacillus terricola TaxID=2763503 RepID=A0ABR8MZ27_9BACL|nr:chemotaxis protein CheW [Paenibacillus terricola]MBD3919784.1 chemotaxis protein CheW [Paenibacillus terricola]